MKAAVTRVSYDKNSAVRQASTIAFAGGKNEFTSSKNEIVRRLGSVRAKVWYNGTSLAGVHVPGVDSVVDCAVASRLSWANVVLGRLDRSQNQTETVMKRENSMKRKIALFSLLGVAGGLLCALESQHRRNKRANAENGANNEAVSGNGRSASANARQKGSLQTKPAASMARVENREASVGSEGEHLIDDRGTDQLEAAQILRDIRDNVFEANDEKLALALGRPTEEIEEWTSGGGLIDGDVILKARRLAILRGFEI